MRLMYDAADPNGIPRDARMVGGYVDGRYAWSTAQWNMFPNAVRVRIAVLPSTNDGTVFDGPPDNGTWPQVVSWVIMRRHAGADPSVYTDGDQWETAQAAFRAAGVAEPHWWIAAWNGVANVPAGQVAHQYKSVTNVYDLSAVLDYWPGVDPIQHAPAGSPPPAPAPAPLMEDDDMLIIQANADAGANFGGAINLLSGSAFINLTSTADVAALQAQGVRLATVSTATFRNMQAAAAALQGSLSGQLGVSGNLTVS